MRRMGEQRIAQLPKRDKPAVQGPREGLGASSGSRLRLWAGWVDAAIDVVDASPSLVYLSAIVMIPTATLLSLLARDLDLLLSRAGGV